MRKRQMAKAARAAHLGPVDDHRRSIPRVRREQVAVGLIGHHELEVLRACGKGVKGSDTQRREAKCGMRGGLIARSKLEM